MSVIKRKKEQRQANIIRFRVARLIWAWVSSRSGTTVGDVFRDAVAASSPRPLFRKKPIAKARESGKEVSGRRRKRKGKGSRRKVENGKTAK